MRCQTVANHATHLRAAHFVEQLINGPRLPAASRALQADAPGPMNRTNRPLGRLIADARKLPEPRPAEPAEPCTGFSAVLPIAPGSAQSIVPHRHALLPASQLLARLPAPTHRSVALCSLHRSLLCISTSKGPSVDAPQSSNGSSSTSSNRGGGGWVRRPGGAGGGQEGGGRRAAAAPPHHSRHLLQLPQR